MKLLRDSLLLSPLLIATALSHSESLTTALQATMANNPSVKGKRAEVDAQYHNISGAKAQRLPSLYVDANNLNDNRSQGTVGLDQPIYTFGKISTAIDREKQRYQAEQWALLDVQRQLIEETAVAYATVLGAKKRLAVAQQNADIHKSLYEQVQRRQQGQLASDVDVELAFSRWHQANSQLMAIRNELATAETDLYALTHSPVPVLADIANAQLALPDDARLMEIAMQQNATIREQREMVHVSELDVKGEKRSLLPDISFRLEHDFLDESLINEDDTRTGFVISSRFDGMGFGNRSAIKNATAQLSAARYQLDASTVEVESRLQKLINDRGIQQQLMESNELAVKAITNTRDSYQRLYEKGRKTWLEVLNTYREVTEQQLQLEASRSEWNILTLRIAAVIGALDEEAGLTE